jgi:hypothetical protein
MLNANTGALSIGNLGVSLGPEVTRSEFLASPLAKGARAIVANEPHHSWQLQGEYASGLPFIVSLYFRGEELAMISLADADKAFVAGDWSRWSEEKELSRKQNHDRWLNSQIGERREFPWGRVFSAYAPKSGGSAIGICYPAWER